MKGKILKYSKCFCLDDWELFDAIFGHDFAAEEGQVDHESPLQLVGALLKERNRLLARRRLVSRTRKIIENSFLELVAENQN